MTAVPNADALHSLGADDPGGTCVPLSGDRAGPELAAASLQAGSLVGITQIRAFFGLGRTAAYELTHRRDFPVPLVLSPRCYRWRATEVLAFAARLRDGSSRFTPCFPQGRPASPRQDPADDAPLGITGTVRYTRRRGSSD
jgi:predicted DNA-binding transcriptional regulator AlpA